MCGSCTPNGGTHHGDEQPDPADLLHDDTPARPGAYQPTLHEGTQAFAATVQLDLAGHRARVRPLRFGVLLVESSSTPDEIRAALTPRWETVERDGAVWVRVQ